MKIAQNKFKRSIEVLKNYGLVFHANTRKYYFSEIKTNKEEYILFLILTFREDNEKVLVNKYAYFNHKTGQLEDITAADVNNVLTKYFKQQ